MALLLAVILWALTGMTVYLVWNHNYWLPPAWSAAAHSYDSQFVLTMTIVGIAFVSAQVLLGLFIFQFRDKGDAGRARYIHGSNFIEVGGVIVTTITFVSLAILGQRLWAQVHLTESPPDALHIEITGQQFIWNVRYPGPDGKLGRNNPKFYESAGNTVGVDPDDPAGRDDIIVQNQLVVPVNRPVELTMRSKDVIHSFFLPTLRLKQDTMPGLAVPLRFTANQTGTFEIACAELCGSGHYNMKGRLQIVGPAEYEKWLSEQIPVFPPEEADEAVASSETAAGEAAGGETTAPAGTASGPAGGSMIGETAVRTGAAGAGQAIQG